MVLYLDKKERRDLEILKILYSEERWWTGEELAKKANCSFESALNSVETLTNLASDLDYVYTIESQKNRGSILVLPPNSSYNRIERLYYRQTISYQIIDRIFQERNLTLEKLMADLYISQSTLYRKLKIIEAAFTENNLTLNKATLTVTGPEIYIREFYYIFYWSLVQVEGWPFKNVRLEVIEYRINDYLQQRQIKLSAVEKVQLAYRLAINFSRHQQKKFINQLPTTVLIDAPRQVFLTDFSTAFTTQVPPQFQEREIEYLSLIIITYQYLIAGSSKYDLTPIVAWHQEHHTLTYRLANDIITRLCQVYQNPELVAQLQQPKILFLLFSVANYAILFPKLGAFERLSSNWEKSLVIFERQNPQFYHVLREIVFSMQSQKDYPEYVMSPSYSFFTLYNIFNYYLNIPNFEEAITVKLIYAVNPISELTLAKLLQEQINHHLVIKTSQNRNDEHQVYDILISDVVFPENIKPKALAEYIWNTPPSYEDVGVIREIIDLLSKTKKPS